MNWELISTEYLTQHPPYFISRKDVCKKPDGTIIPAYYVVELPPSVIVFPVTGDSKVMMTKQYRHPVGEVMVELPGGFIDEGETPLVAAKRELLEETGYRFTAFEYLGKLAANPGVLNNYTHMFLASGVSAIETPQPESSEEIDLVFYSLDEVSELLRSNKMAQSLHACACFYALERLKENP